MPDMRRCMMRKRLQSVLFAAAFLLISVLMTAVGVFAGGGSSQTLGKCGKNAEAVMIPYGGGVNVLQILGEGAMYNFASGGTDAPWYGKSFVAVQFEEGITTVGANAFNKGVKRVYLPSTVTKVGDDAFSKATTIETVYYGDMRTKWNALKSKHNVLKNKPLFECKNLKILVQPPRTYDLRNGSISLSEWAFGMLSRSLGAAAQQGGIVLESTTSTKTRYDLDWNGVYDLQLERFSEGGVLSGLPETSIADKTLKINDLWVRNSLLFSRLQFASEMHFQLNMKPKIDINTATVKGQLSPVDYTGTKTSPKISLWRNSLKLQPEEDYVMLGYDNIDPGMATLYIYGINKYTGSMVLNYEITKSDIGWPKLSGMKFTYEYTGSAIKPNPKLVYEDFQLEKGKHYKLAYKNNTDAGTATLTVYGLGGYTGYRTVNYDITPKVITPSVSFSETEIEYDGAGHTPELVVKDGSKVISASSYTVTGDYKNKIKVGRYTAKATLKNNYIGSGSAAYKILPPHTYITSVTGMSSTSFVVNWKQVTAQTKGYQVQIATDKNFTKDAKMVRITDKLKTSYKFTGLKQDTVYYIRVRTYLYKDSTYYNSKWSAVKNVKTNAAKG